MDVAEPKRIRGLLSRAPWRDIERPGRTVAIFAAVALFCVAADALALMIATGVSASDALFSPPPQDRLLRIGAVVLVAVLAILGEIALTRYQRTSRELRAEQVRLRSLYEKHPSPIVALDRELQVTFLNDRAVEAVGLPAESVRGQVCHKAIMGIDQPCEGCLVEQVFETGKPHSRIKHEVTLGGRENWLAQVWYAIPGADGEVESVVEIASDVSALKLDELTSLPNRLLLRDRLDIALAGAKRHGQLMAVLFMDIDGFKRVNDTMGHAAGDALLTGFAERLRGIVRQDETLARVSGDEFVLLLPSVESGEDVGRTAARIIEHLRAPFVIGGRDLPITASIGITLFAGGEATAEELLDRADQAMYAAKSQGGNTFRTSGADGAVRVEQPPSYS